MFNLYGHKKMKRRSTLALAITLAVGSQAMAKSPEESIREVIGPNMPGIKTVAPATVGLDGLWQITTESGEVFYSNADGSRLIVGNVWDTVAKRNLTQEAIDVAQRIDFSSIKLEDANFVTVHKDANGKADRKLVVFSDPQCGYCKQFERDVVANLKNATVYTFVVNVLGPNSENLIKQIGCETDQKKAYVDFMTKNITPSNPGLCEAGSAMLNKAKQATATYAIRSTPTSYVQSGTPIRGALPLGDVDLMMNSN